MPDVVHLDQADAVGITYGPERADEVPGRYRPTSASSEDDPQCDARRGPRLSGRAVSKAGHAVSAPEAFVSSTPVRYVSEAFTLVMSEPVVGVTEPDHGDVSQHDASDRLAR